MHKIVEFAGELGVRLYPAQAQAVSDYMESGRPHFLLIAGRRSGKSLLSDILVLWDACIGDYSRFLLPGEPRYIIIVSTRLDNAQLHVKQCARLLRHSPELRRMIVEENKDRLTLRNGVTVLSLPASARSIRGYGASLLVLDEAAFFVDVNESNMSADEILTAAEPTLAQFDGGRVVITTSPSAPSGLVFDLFERKLPDWHIVKRTTQEMNPMIGQAVIDRAMARDAESAQAEYFAEWRAATEAFLNADRVDACVNHSRSQVESAQIGESYLMSCDPATLRDNYGLLVSHVKEGRVTVDYAKSLKPPIDLNAAEALLADLARRFHPSAIYCDTASTTERLRDKLPTMRYVPFSRPTKLRCYSSLKESVNLGLLDLPGDVPELVAELKALRLRNGVDVSAPTSGRIRHDDLADCLALVADASATGGHTWVGRTVFYGPLVDAPMTVYQRIEPGGRKPLTQFEWEKRSEESRKRDGSLSDHWHAQQARLRYGKL